MFSFIHRHCLQKVILLINPSPTIHDDDLHYWTKLFFCWKWKSSNWASIISSLLLFYNICFVQMMWISRDQWTVLPLSIGERMVAGSHNIVQGYIHPIRIIRTALTVLSFVRKEINRYSCYSRYNLLVQHHTPIRILVYSYNRAGVPQFRAILPFSPASLTYINVKWRSTDPMKNTIILNLPRLLSYTYKINQASARNLVL